MLWYQSVLLQAQHKGCGTTNFTWLQKFSREKKFPDFYQFSEQVSRLSRKSCNPLSFILSYLGGTCSLHMPALRPAWPDGVCSCLPCRAIVGGIGSGETLCHDIYPARPITTVSLTANTYCMMDGHSSCAPHTVGPRVQFSGACEQSHWWPTRAYSRRPSVISGSSSD